MTEQRDGGFTILEALCAFAILSVVLVSLYALGGTSLGMLSISTGADRVALLAQSKIDELATVRAALPAFQTGRFEGTEVRWALATQELPQGDSEARAFHLQAVRLTLTWPSLRGTDEFAIASRHMWSDRQ